MPPSIPIRSEASSSPSALALAIEQLNARAMSNKRTSVMSSRRYSVDFEDPGTDDDEELVTRNVRLSDNHLLHLALEAAQSINWRALSEPLDSERSAAWTEVKPKTTSRRRRRASSSTTGSTLRTTIYTRNDNHTHPSSFAAMSHTVVPCSLRELALMLESTSSDQFGDVMQAIHGDALVSAELVHHVATDQSLSSNTVSSGLLVKAVTLDKKKAKDSSRASNFFGLRQPSEEWCYLDFVQRISANVVRKTLFTLHPSRLFVGKELEEDKQHPPGTLAGYLFEELEDGKSTRISFWGEHVYDPSGGKLRRALANRAVKARILGLAESIGRFILVVRRRRLGVQVMADEIKVQSSNTSCACCDRSFMLTKKKICNLCGYYVCEKCSQMEDRERRASNGRKLSVSRVRICEKCIARVDECSYANVSLEDLSPVQIYADPLPVTPKTPASTRSSTATSTIQSPVTTGKLLTNVLLETMERSTDSLTSPVLSIIKHIVNQESQSPSSSLSILTNESTEKQHFDALRSTLRDPPLSLDECRLANAEQRSYLIGHSPDPTVSHPFPIPASEERRLEIIRASKLTSLEGVDELDIICSIVSKELECLGAMISISETDAFHVVATNIDFLPTRVFPRNEGFCSRTIMGVDPMLVPHPEADTRFSYILPVKHMNISFYCGFPLFAEDFTVLGSLCCLGYDTRKLTQSQFTIGRKLAETASKILQHHVRLRQNRTEL